MKVILDHLIKEIGDEHKFGCLPESCYNSPCQLGVIALESFSEIMTSASNVLVDAHRLHLNDDMIDEMIILRMNKKFMERIRTQKYFSSVAFSESKEGENV